MSFPKAPLKRFNEHVGCAPAPGSYEVRDPDGMKGAVSFPKSQRFQKAKDDLTCSAHSLENDRDFASPLRSRKQHHSLGSTPNLSRRPEKDSDFIREMKKQKKLEKEIRSLMQERGELDRRLHALEDEFKKTEAKLTAALREKSSLSASMASLERQLADLHKANELLKNKFSDDGTKKKMHSLCAELMEAKNKLESKEKEWSYLQIKFEGQVKVLQADLEESKTNLYALQEKNKYLEDAHREAKLQSEDLEMEMDKLHALIEQLRGENKDLHGYLADAQDQIVELRGQMSTKEREYEDALKLAKSSMEEQSQMLAAQHEELELKLQVAQTDLETALQREAHLGEKLAATDLEKEKVIEEKAETERKLLEHIHEISRVSAQVEKYKLDLAQSEELLKEKDEAGLTQKNLFMVKETEFFKQIKELDERCQSLELEKGTFETESQEKEQTLNTEVESLKVKLEEGKAGSQMLQQKQVELVARLNQEEELTNALRQELLQVQEEMLTERGLLEKELEGTLVELDRLQLEEEQAEKIIAHLEHENKQRSEELNQLELTLKEKNAELEKINVINSKAVVQFEEEQRSTLCKLGEVTTEFESYKVLMNGEVESLKTKNSSLLEKVADLDKCVLDTQQQLQEMRHSTAKAKEEYARMLLDVQTKLAVKEAEIKKSEDNHFTKITELHNQLEQQNEALQKEREEVECLRGKSMDEQVVHELKEEIRKWRTLYEDLHHKVKPFQQQLDMFEAEKNALLNEHGAAQDELNKLSDAYAKLLGHQNQRQKIKHVMKLKEENTQLKQEVSRLRGQLSKEKPTVQGGKRFDPSKSFQGDSKENDVPKTPLKEGNRKVTV